MTGCIIIIAKLFYKLTHMNLFHNVQTSTFDQMFRPILLNRELWMSFWHVLLFEVRYIYDVQHSKRYHSDNNYSDTFSFYLSLITTKYLPCN